MTEEPTLKPVVWVGSTRNDLRAFPDPVQDHMGYAIYVAQRGGKHSDTKMLSGFGGAGVLEVVKDFRGDTFRPFIPCGMRGPSTWSMCFRRSRRRGERHRGEISS
jgi:phage-related protein